MAGNTVVVSVLADTARFKKDMGGLGASFSTFKSAAKVAVVAVGAAMAKLGFDSVKSASKLEQAVGGVDAVFKENARTVHAWAKSAADDVGLSRAAYSEFSTYLGSMLKNAGVPLDQLAGKTRDYIKLGSDLAATFGFEVSDAVDALGSAMRGEMDPIEKFGISLKESDIQARLAADGTDKLTGAAGKAAREAAIWNLMLEQSADALGATDREADTYAATMQRLNAKFEDAKAALGEQLLPVMVEVMEWLSATAIPTVLDFAEAWGLIKPNADEASKGMGDFRVEAEKVPTDLELMHEGFLDFLDALGTVPAAYQNVEDSVRAFGEYLRGPGTMTVVGYVAGLVKGFHEMRVNVGVALDQTKLGIINKWAEILVWLDGVPGKIRGVFSGAGTWLTAHGVAVLTGFLTGLKQKWAEIQSFVSGIGTWIKNNKGPLSYDYKLLQPAGKAIMDGFGDALTSGFSDVQRMVSGFAPALADSFAPELAMAPAAASGAATIYSFNGLTFTAASDAEASVLEEFVALARRKARAA